MKSELQRLGVFRGESLEADSQAKSLNMDVQDVQDAEQEKSDGFYPVHPCSKCFVKSSGMPVPRSRLMETFTNW
jgi:hypothetical protein